MQPGNLAVMWPRDQLSRPIKKGKDSNLQSWGSRSQDRGQGPGTNLHDQKSLPQGQAASKRGTVSRHHISPRNRRCRR